MTPKKQATVTRLDGKPLVRDADGLVHGEPLNLTPEQRAALPPLMPDEGAPSGYATGVSAAAPDPFRQTIEIARGPNAAGLSAMTHAAHGIEPDRRASDDETALERLAQAEAAGALPAADRRADGAAPTPKET
jgi:hypothetical protein